MSRKVYVIGHCQPDTDSIASVIGYAEFLNRQEPDRYIAARCGDLNSETRFALAKFGREPPIVVDSVEPLVADIPSLYMRSAPADMPTIDVACMMDEQDVRNIPVIDTMGRFIGIVSEYGLAKAYVTPERREDLQIGPIPLHTLARILDARIHHAASDILQGKVTIVIDALHVALSRLTSRDIAVVGDHEPVQLALISAGIAALVLAEGAPVGERVLAAASSGGVSILATDLNAFSVGRMVHLSLPARQVVATDVPTVRPEDPLAYAKQLVTNSRYRTACVVDREGKYLGMISRNTFLDEIQKSVILLDHNEFAQAVDGIETAEILEVIDHHRLGVISTLKPVKFLNDPVGSTSTIIALKFSEEGFPPVNSTAGMLLAGILSDTLVLQMSTTTDTDRRAVAYLAGITGIDPIAFGATLLRQSTDLGETPLGDVLTRDTKQYTLFGRQVIIAQVMVASRDYYQDRASEIRKELEFLRREKGVDLYLVLFTHVIENASDLFISGDSAVIASLGYADQPIRLAGVMSRKKDFLPGFGKHLREL